MRKKLKPSVLIFAVILVLQIGYSAVYTHVCYARVPDVVGLSASKAVKLCEEKGITLRKIDESGNIVSEKGCLIVANENGECVATRNLEDFVVTKQSREPGEMFKRKGGLLEDFRQIAITDILILTVERK